MTKPLVFMMGRSPAFLPVDRQYTRTHMWVLPGNGIVRLGFSAYAVRLLGDIHKIVWTAEQGRGATAGEPLGTIEGSKAVSDVYSPVDGVVQSVNPAVLADPSLLNSNLYDDGWLLEIRAPQATLLSPDEYFQYLEHCWPLAQRLLKGQATRSSGESRTPSNED
jgi:glycine cleavage system H protein